MLNKNIKLTNEGKEKSNPPVFESILFTTLSEEQIHKAKVSEVAKFIQLICIEFNLKANRLADYNKAKNILINSVKYN